MERVLLLCCRSCLKGDDDREYYTALGLTSKRSTQDEIKKAYKKTSLSLHPDKIAQRGEQVTPESRQQFLKAKEAYDVLSDPKRRKLYDKLGATGLKLMEAPQEISPVELLKNFQKNRQDRLFVVLLVLLIFAALLILPILFSLKCDQTLGSNAPWTAIWTPMWVFDLAILLLAISMCSASSNDDDDSSASGSAKGEGKSGESGELYEDEHKAKEKVNIPWHLKILNFVTTVLFILIQVFILIRMDHDVSWSWFATFAPWFIYEFVTAAALTPTAFQSIATPVAHVRDNEEAADEDSLLHQLAEEAEYFEKVIQRHKDYKAILVCVLRAWLAVFLALQLDNTVNWNWGLVLLPIWLFVALQLYYIIEYRTWGNQLMAGIDTNNETMPTDPQEMSRLQRGQGLVGMSSTLCVSQCIFLLMALMLVSRLQVSSFSTFIIIFPVFVILGCCCCVVFTMLSCASCVDTEELSKQVDEEMGGGASSRSGAAAGAGAGAGAEESGNLEGTYVPPPPPTSSTVVFVPPPPSSTSEGSATTAAYGTFNDTQPLPQPPTSSAEVVVVVEDKADINDLD